MKNTCDVRGRSGKRKAERQWRAVVNSVKKQKVRVKVNNNNFFGKQADEGAKRLREGGADAAEDYLNFYVQNCEYLHKNRQLYQILGIKFTNKKIFLKKFIKRG